MRHERIAHHALAAKLIPTLGRHPRLISTAKTVRAQGVRAQQGHQHSAIRYQVARQTNIEECQPATAIAPVNPVLCRELYSVRSIDRSKWNLVSRRAFIDCYRKMCLV